MKHLDVKKTKLSNGLTVITVCRESGVFSLAVGIKAGSIYEDRENSGISHMIEHMLFKGTAKRSMEQLSSDVEKLAGDIDIYTTYHETALSASVIKDRAENLLEVVSDMLLSATFPSREFNLEKKVIIEEIKMAKDDLEEWSYLGLHRAAFRDTWYKYNIAGTINSVRSIKREDLMKFYKTFYVPNNTVVCTVSSYSHEEVLEMVHRYFDSWEPGNINIMDDDDYQIPVQKVISHKKGIEQAHILYGFDVHKLDRRERVILSLLNKKVGSGANSVLFRELRDKKGYAYNVYSDMDLTEHIGMFYIYAAVSHENLKNAVSLIDDIVTKFENGSFEIDERNVSIIKDIFLTDMIIALESSAHIADYLLDGEMEYSDPMEYENVLSIMDTVSIDDIKSVAEKTFKMPIIYILSPK